MIHRIHAKKYKRTKKGVTAVMFSSQIQSSKNRGYDLPEYSMLELREWCFSQPIFHKLYNEWVECGYKKEMKPSCDRTNDYKGYSLDRLRIVTWDENNKRGRIDRKNGINNKVNRAVLGVDIISGKEIKYHSMRNAARITGVSRYNMYSCCLGKRKAAGGYKWKYA